MAWVSSGGPILYTHRAGEQVFQLCRHCAGFQCPHPKIVQATGVGFSCKCPESKETATIRISPNAPHRKCVQCKAFLALQTASTVVKYHVLPSDKDAEVCSGHMHSPPARALDFKWDRGTNISTQHNPITSMTRKREATDTHFETKQRERAAQHTPQHHAHVRSTCIPAYMHKNRRHEGSHNCCHSCTLFVFPAHPATPTSSISNSLTHILTCVI